MGPSVRGVLLICSNGSKDVYFILANELISSFLYISETIKGSIFINHQFVC